MSADKWCARTDLALETQESLKKANTDMRGVNFSEKKLDNGIIVSVVQLTQKMQSGLQAVLKENM